MPWKDRLQKATFRGVPFEVEADDGAFGRRVQLHEYPQRDVPFAEDMGRKAREISLTGFLVGPEYMAARDRLLKAIEEPGPGTLVHPWYGQLTVVVKDDGCRVQHSNRDGGMCQLQLTFVEAGELAFPSSSSAIGTRTQLAADELQTVSIDNFAADFEVEDLPAWVLEDAVDQAGAILDTIDGALTSVGGILSNPVGDMQGVLGDLLPEPPEFARRLFGLFSKAQAIVQTSGRVGDFSTINHLRALTTVRSVALFQPTDVSSSLTPARQQLVVNRNALNTITRQALLVQAAGMAATMPLPVYDDAIALRKELLASLDAEAQLADDTTYNTLMDLRTAVHADVTARVRSSARLREVRPAEVIPALALAYDLYEDTAREGEIVARNRLRHPGFVPAEPIKVLSV